MPRASRPCPTPGCGQLTQGGRCGTCASAAERARGTSTQRGYARNPEHRTFRAHVLTRAAGQCQIRLDTCTEHATVADHWPLSRRELIARHLNPNDPTHGRAACASCHSKETARHQPGGWNTH